MEKYIFVINGSGGAGKDTFVNMVSKYVPTINFSSVDKVKDAARFMGWKGEKTNKDRRFLSDLKALASAYNDMPHESIREKIQSFCGDDINNFLFIHIREPEEIERVVEEFGAMTILVKNDNIPHIESNLSDRNVFNFSYDFEIDNSGSLMELNDKAKQFCKRWSL